MYNLTSYMDEYATFGDFEKGVWNNMLTKVIIMYSSTFAVLLPICLLNNIAKLRYISVFAIIAMLYVIMVSKRY